MLGMYRNGNYHVILYSDGTKLRYTNDDEFLPEFAESCDVMITDYCDGGCAYCYAGCSVHGKHADLLHQEWVDSLHPYTELAINGNDLSHPQLEEFLGILKSKGVIANLTVNQKHFMRPENLEKLHRWSSERLIRGLGVSYVKEDPEFLAEVKKFPDAVIHVIAGLIYPEDLEFLEGNNLKLLILGYKNIGRGREFLERYCLGIEKQIQWLKKLLEEEKIQDGFSVVGFDTLAVKQLDLEKVFDGKVAWSEFYMGDDGLYTFYIDCVHSRFAKSSISQVTYPLWSSVDDMFRFIRKKEREKH